MKSKRLIVIGLLFFSGLSFGQEDCYNGIDDDGDGLIDLNDDECECDGLFDVESLIPNHSFEDHSCCPMSWSELFCADTWIQASTATSDYWNVCGMEGPNALWALFENPEFPLPGDGTGEGYGGFISQDWGTSNYNEYIGACLLSPMLSGVTYVLNLYVARGHGEENLNFSIFGTPNCGDMPWAGSDCPIGVGSWELLSETPIVMGTLSEWQEVTVTFTPSVDIAAIVIGGSCTPYPLAGESNNYYYLDEITLLDSDSYYGLEVTGSWCTDDLLLTGSTDLLGGSWQWYKDGIALLGEVDETLDPVPYGPGEFDAVYTLDGVCKRLSYTSPDPDIAANFTFEPFCFPEETVFDNTSTFLGVDGLVWAWDFGDGGISADENPTHSYLVEGTYTVSLTVTSYGDCESVYTTDVIVSSGLVTMSPDTTICQNGTATVYATIEDGLDYIFDWSIPGSDDGTIQDVVGLVDDYMVYVTAESGGCSIIDSIQIFVNPPITVNVSPNDTVCAGLSSGATVVPAGGNGDYTYEWTGNSLSIVDDAPTINTNPILTTTYCVTVSDGCETDPVSICTETYVPEVTVDFIADTTEGCELSLITFTSNMLPVSLLNIYTWTINGETLSGNSVAYFFENEGSYSITLNVLTPEGCVTNLTKTNYITIHPLPTPQIFATPNPTSSFNTLVKLVNVEYESTSSFQWSFASGNPSHATNAASVDVRFPEFESGSYAVSLIETTNYGCIDSTSLIMVINNDQIIYVPNIFTPDGDNINNTWGVHLEGFDIYDFHLTVFNRWGEIVWESFDITGEWDGSYGDGLIQDGTYVWVIQAKDIENDKMYEFNGTVNVLK